MQTHQRSYLLACVNHESCQGTRRRKNQQRVRQGYCPSLSIIGFPGGSGHPPSAVRVEHAGAPPQLHTVGAAAVAAAVAMLAAAAAAAVAAAAPREAVLQFAAAQAAAFALIALAVRHARAIETVGHNGGQYWLRFGSALR